MKKINLIIFFVVTFSALNLYSIEKINVSAFVDKNIIISPKKIGAGIWQLVKYNRNILDLIEDIKEPFPSFVFKAKKIGQSIVELKYVEKNKIMKNLIYKVEVVNNNNINKNNRTILNDEFHLTLKSKIERVKKKSFKKAEKLQKNSNEDNKGSTEHLPEREITKNGDVYYEFISNLYRRKLYQQALEEIEKYLLLFSKHSKIEKIKLLKAEVFIKNKQYQDAIDWYKYLINEDHKYFYKKGNLIIKIGESYEKINDYAKARLYYIKILTLYKDPNLLSKTHFNLGKLYFKEKKYKEGIIELESLIKNYPESNKSRETSLFLLGEMYYKNSSFKNYKKAFNYFKMLTNEFPNNYYSKKAMNRMEYLKQNFIEYF